MKRATMTSIRIRETATKAEHAVTGRRKRGTVNYSQLERKRLLQPGLADRMKLGVTGPERAGGWGLIAPVVVQAAACI